MIKAFETGKEYFVNGGGAITVNKRTNCYLWISGKYLNRFSLENKKLLIDKTNLFGLGESVIFPNINCRQLVYFCFAGHEKTEG